MNVLVTGGAGFIGSNLVHHLLEEGISGNHPPSVGKVVTLDKLTYAGNLNNLAQVLDHPCHTFVQGDIVDGQLVARLLGEHDIDAIFHLAAETHVDRSIDRSTDFIHSNILGTHSLLDAFRGHLRRSRRDSMPGFGRPLAEGGTGLFLHVSTDEVYGSLAEGRPAFTEATPYAPNNPYSASKAAADHLARAWFHTYRTPVVITCCSNNYGPFQFPEKLLPLMIRKALRHETLPVYGDGGNVRDWIFVDDHCRGLLAAATRGTPGETYCIGGRCEMRNIEVVRMVVELVRELAPEAKVPPADELITFVTDRPGHDRRYAIAPTKISTELGWEPLESFETGLRKTIRWYLDNQHWLDAIESGSYRGERLGLTT